MSPLSLRALLLALVMVVQTIAGGAAIARAMPGGVHAAISAHCDRASNAADNADDPRSDGRHHNCEACCLCAGPPTAALAQDGQLPAVERIVVRAGFALSDTSAITARVAQARLARGPPAARMKA